jgi:integrase/recombinase XerC
MNSEGRGYRTGQDWEATRTHTEGGANNLVKNLSSLLGWCVDQGFIEARPFKIKALKAQERPEGIVWPEQVQAFLEVAYKGGRSHSKQPDKPPEHSYTAMRMMLTLGLREDEALTARWEWFDERRMVYSPGKTKNRKVREIPVPPALALHLGAIRNGKEKGLILPSKKKSANGHELPHNKNFTQKPVKRCAEALKIYGLTPHRLRATFATTHFEAGTPISQIQQMMGHDDPQTTMGYIVQRPKDQHESQARVEALQGFTSLISPDRVPIKSTNKEQAV